MSNTKKTHPLTQVTAMFLDGEVDRDEVLEELKHLGVASDRANGLLDRWEEAAPEDLSHLDVKALQDFPAEMLDAVTRLAIESNNLQAITAIADSAWPRDARKAAKKQLAVLKAKGAKLPGKPVAPASPVITAAESDDFPPWAFATAIDAAGDQMIWLGLWKKGQGLTVHDSMLNCSNGIVDYYYAYVSRSEARDYERKLQARTGEANPMVCRVTPEWAAARLRRAQAVNKARQAAVSQRYQFAQPWLCQFDAAATALPEPSGLDDLVKESARLAEDNYFLRWVPPQEWLVQTEQKMMEAFLSPLLVTPEQKLEEGQSRMRKAIADFWSADRRRAYAGRLIESAFLFSVMPDRKHLVELALASARALEAADTAIENIPFAFALMKRWFRMPNPEQLPRARSDSTSLLVDASGQSASDAAPGSGKIILP
ncbi:MAG: hypothetical protein GMKNLPBB_01850 [Myxococcota bacterium]|nr:hypothetical protein [Myxococcota bacterium]